jgi:hypothetical protein
MSARRAVFALAAVAAVLLAGCSQRYSAERDGKKLGQALCDLKTATTAEDAADAKNDVTNQLNDLGNKYALATAEDRNDIERNLADLAEHTVQGNDTLEQQDLAVLRRSLGNIVEDTDEVAEAAWEGVGEGLSDCTA